MTHIFCPRCMRRVLKEHGRFNGTEGLGRVVKGLVFNDEEICSGCADELLAKVTGEQIETVDADAHEWTLNYVEALEARTSQDDIDTAVAEANAKTKEASTEELMRVFAMTASRARPELEVEGNDW